MSARMVLCSCLLYTSVYSSVHDMILFAYKTYFGFIPLKEMTIEGSTYQAGTALYFDLAKLVGDDYITGITDLPYGDDDMSYNEIITSSGIDVYKRQQ